MQDVTAPWDQLPPPNGGGSWQYQVPVLLPVGTGWINANRPPRGTAQAIEYSRWKHRFRFAAVQALEDAGVPQGCSRAEVLVELRFSDRRQRDPDNFLPTYKPMIDALEPERVVETTRTHRVGRRIVQVPYTQTIPGWGVIPNDSTRYLTRHHPIIGDRLIPRDPSMAGVVIMHLVVGE